MKRKVLLVIGKSDLLLKGEYSFKTEKLEESLRKRDDIELVVVGDYKSDNFDYDALNRAISELKEEQPITIIMNTHGTINKGNFEFIMDSNSDMSSKTLFNLVSERIPNTPVDLFTPACHGGGIIDDKDLLPRGSTLVALTDANTVNNGGDFSKMPKFIDSFNFDLSAYNLLQLFLSKSLKNRFHPHIGISGGNSYSLDDLLKTAISNPLDFDFSHSSLFGSENEYRKIFDKIVNSSSEWFIYAAEYGIALSIILNDLKNKKELDIPNGSMKM